MGRRLLRAFMCGMLIFALSGAALLFKPQPAAACSCAIVSQSEMFEQAGLVFAGTMLDSRKAGLWESLFSGARFGSAGGLSLMRANHFQVDTVWKGGTGGAKLTIYDSGGGASCGIDFKRGESYLVYALKSDSGKWYTHLCTRTAKLAAAADDLQALGEGESVSQSVIGSRGLYKWIVIGGVLLGALWAGWVARRRRG